MTEQSTEYAYIHEGGIDIMHAPVDHEPRYTLSSNPVDVAYGKWLTEAFLVGSEDES